MCVNKNTFRICLQLYYFPPDHSHSKLTAIQYFVLLLNSGPCAFGYKHLFCFLFVSTFFFVLPLRKKVIPTNKPPSHPRLLLPCTYTNHNTYRLYFNYLIICLEALEERDLCPVYLATFLGVSQNLLILRKHKQDCSEKGKLQCHRITV